VGLCFLFINDTRYAHLNSLQIPVISRRQLKRPRSKGQAQGRGFF